MGPFYGQPKGLMGAANGALSGIAQLLQGLAAGRARRDQDAQDQQAQAMRQQQFALQKQQFDAQQEDRKYGRQQDAANAFLHQFGGYENPAGAWEQYNKIRTGGDPNDFGPVPGSPGTPGMPAMVQPGSGLDLSKLSTGMPDFLKNGIPGMAGLAQNLPTLGGAPSAPSVPRAFGMQGLSQGPGSLNGGAAPVQLNLGHPGDVTPARPEVPAVAPHPRSPEEFIRGLGRSPMQLQQAQSQAEADLRQRNALELAGVRTDAQRDHDERMAALKRDLADLGARAKSGDVQSRLRQSLILGYLRDGGNAADPDLARQYADTLLSTPRSQGGYAEEASPAAAGTPASAVPADPNAPHFQEIPEMLAAPKRHPNGMPIYRPNGATGEVTPVIAAPPNYFPNGTTAQSRIASQQNQNTNRDAGTAIKQQNADTAGRRVDVSTLSLAERKRNNLAREGIARDVVDETGQHHWEMEQETTAHHTAMERQGQERIDNARPLTAARIAALNQRVGAMINGGKVDPQTKEEMRTLRDQLRMSVSKSNALAKSLLFAGEAEKPGIQDQISAEAAHQRQLDTDIANKAKEFSLKQRDNGASAGGTANPAWALKQMWGGVPALPPVNDAGSAMNYRLQLKQAGATPDEINRAVRQRFPGG